MGPRVNVWEACEPCARWVPMLEMDLRPASLVCVAGHVCAGIVRYLLQLNTGEARQHQHFDFRVSRAVWFDAPSRLIFSGDVVAVGFVFRVPTASLLCRFVSAHAGWSVMDMLWILIRHGAWGPLMVFERRHDCVRAPTAAGAVH